MMGRRLTSHKPEIHATERRIGGENARGTRGTC